jgi:DNA-binding NarL/FixJ family response regulator
MSIKVLVADDHEIVRTGLKSLLADTDIKVVAEATRGNRILIAGKSGEDPCQEVVIPAGLEPFAAETAF